MGHLSLRTGSPKGSLSESKGFRSQRHTNILKRTLICTILNPVKRNSKLISRHNMLDFTGILSGMEGDHIPEGKCTGTEKWLYSYRDSYKASKEERDWLRRAKRIRRTASTPSGKNKKRSVRIVLESDLDLPSEIAYKAYEKRWGDRDCHAVLQISM